MTELTEILLNIFSAVVTCIIIPLIIFLGKKLSDYLKTKTDNEIVKTLIEEATAAVTIAVSKIMQTYVDTLKKQGSFTEEAQKVAFLQAKEIALTLISEEAKKAIEAVYGDFNVWLEALIESKVKEIK